MYFISRGDVLNSIDKKTLEVLRREASFKAVYYDGRCEGRTEKRYKGKPKRDERGTFPFKVFKSFP